MRRLRPRQAIGRRTRFDKADVAAMRNARGQLRWRPRGREKRRRRERKEPCTGGNAHAFQAKPATGAPPLEKPGGQGVANEPCGVFTRVRYYCGTCQRQGIYSDKA
eukprot:ctg_504.g299